MNLNNILIKPVISEKSQKESENGRYIFLVSPDADKDTIKKAVMDIFEVTPIDVRVMPYLKKKKRNVKGKIRFKTYTRGKKAIVQLQKGEVINIFDQSES